MRKRFPVRRWKTSFYVVHGAANRRDILRVYANQLGEEVVILVAPPQAFPFPGDRRPLITRIYDTLYVAMNARAISLEAWERHDATEAHTHGKNYAYHNARAAAIERGFEAAYQYFGYPHEVLDVEMLERHRNWPRRRANPGAGEAAPDGDASA